MTGLDRDAVRQALAPELVQLVADRLDAAGGDGGDFLSIGLSALVEAALALAATACVDARAAIALVSCTAESAAPGFYPVPA